MVGHGVDPSRRAGLRAAQRPGHRGAAGRDARGRVGRLVLASSMVVYGEGRYDCPEHGSVRPGPRARRGHRGRPLRAALPELRAGAGARAGRRGRGAGPAQHATRRPSWPRSTWPAPGPGRPGARCGRCATTTCTARGCRATPRTRAWRRSSGRRWSAASRRGCWRTGAQRRDFVHVSDVAAANVLALARGAAGRGRGPGERLLRGAAHHPRPGHRAGRGDAAGRRRPWSAGPGRATCGTWWPIAGAAPRERLGFRAAVPASPTASPRSPPTRCATRRPVTRR